MSKIKTTNNALSNRDKKITLLITTIAGAIAITAVFKLGELAGSALYHLGVIL